MGTSSRYNGPNKSPLLPSDFNEYIAPTLPNNENPTVEAPVNSQSEAQPILVFAQTSWSLSKNMMSRFASGSSSDFKSAVSSYVKSHGGARNASKSAKSGIKSTTNIGRFFNNTLGQGIRETLTQSNIAFEGRSAKDILNDLINLLAPIPITKEDAVARKSFIRTMEVLYEKINDDKNDITSFEKIDKDLLNEIVPLHIESYIYERLINDLGSRLEEKSSSPGIALIKEKEIKEYINSKVEVTLKGKDFSQINFNDNRIEIVIEKLFNQCYKVMEDMI